MLKDQLDPLFHAKGQKFKVKWVFPTASEQPVTANGGFKMTSWMNLDAIPVLPNCKDHGDDMKASMKVVHSEITKLQKLGIPAAKIVVGGFSQGGCMSLLSALSFPEKLAACCCLSGWCALEPEWPALHSDANKNIPIFWGHGAADPTVVPECQTIGVAALKANGRDVEVGTYPGVQHSASPQEMADLGMFIGRAIGALPPK